jgi:transcriptional regulator with XRE-family HTH domain
MKQNKRFAIWLGRARREARLTQEQLAERMGVAQPTIGYWESEGRLAMEPEEIRQLAAHLRVSPVQIAAALGYPTEPAAPALPAPGVEDEGDPVFIATEIARLSSRLAELLGEEEAGAGVRVNHAGA